MSPTHLLLILLPFAAAAVDAGKPAAPTASGLEFFERQVRPLLADKCYSCHGAEAAATKKLKGDLRLDTWTGISGGGTSGKPAVIPGNPTKSPLISAVHWQDEDTRMPPKTRMEEAQVAVLEQWVQQGAPHPDAGTAPSAPAKPKDSGRDHWAFQPLKPVDPPVVADAAWARTGVDRFVRAKLAEKGLRPAAAADPRALIRRATFDLTGLPPTLEEIDAFVNDLRPDAFATVVDRLLASPHYGERWGRHWLDLVRYADTAGESADYPVPQAYRYRNWVIDAVNRDLPFDRFLAHQLAGDLLPHANEDEKREHIVATGFVAIARRFGVGPEGNMHLTIEDTLDTLGRAVLGLSLSCARCHDHKFDPIPTTDYYALYGIFASTRYPFPGSENNKRQRDFVPLVQPAEVDALLAPHQERIAKIDAEMKALEAEMAVAKKADPAANAKPDPQAPDAAASAPGTPAAGTVAVAKTRRPTEIRKVIDDVRKRRDKLTDELPEYPNAYAVIDATAKNARVQKRGEPSKAGDEVPRGWLGVLGGQQLANRSGSGRRELAQWLFQHPLAARVLANRLWQHHFGRGLVATPSDFGTRGAPPSHPELLEWLAGRVIERGWSLKALHRELLLTSTYRMAAQDDAKAAASDPENVLLWRANRRRLDAEEVRDAMLAASGLLERGPAQGHAFPPTAKWDWTQHKPFTAVYDSNRRSIYVMQQRIRRHPFFALFDGADTNVSTGERAVSTTPLQALFLLNDPFVHAQSAALAKRVTDTGADDQTRVTTVFRLALGRTPTAPELAAVLSHLARPGGTGWEGVARVVMQSNEFVFVD